MMWKKKKSPKPQWASLTTFNPEADPVRVYVKSNKAALGEADCNPVSQLWTFKFPLDTSVLIFPFQDIKMLVAY